MKMPVFVYYIIAAVLLLGLGTCAVKKIQNDAVDNAFAKETIKSVVSENVRVNALVDTLRRSGARDRARGDSALKVAEEALTASRQDSKDIASADSAAATVDTTDWRNRYLASIPQITSRDKKIADQEVTIKSQASTIALYLSDATKGWAAVDSLKKNNANLVNKGIKAALAIQECHVGPLPCPPRWAVALGTGLATLYVTRKK